MPTCYACGRHCNRISEVNVYSSRLTIALDTKILFFFFLENETDLLLYPFSFVHSWDDLFLLLLNVNVHSMRFSALVFSKLTENYGKCMRLIAHVLCVSCRMLLFFFRNFFFCAQKIMRCISKCKCFISEKKKEKEK